LKKTNQFSVEVTCKNGWLKIYLCGLLHLALRQKDLIGVQSWMNDGMYLIEYTTTDQEVLTEYDDRQKWEALLHKLDDVLV
jgi:hypothetical protein